MHSHPQRAPSITSPVTPAPAVCQTRPYTVSAVRKSSLLHCKFAHIIINSSQAPPRARRIIAVRTALTTWTRPGNKVVLWEMGKPTFGTQYRHESEPTQSRITTSRGLRSW